MATSSSSSSSAEKPKSDPPHGMEPYDLGNDEGNLGALSSQQQQRLNDFKVKTRLENEKYLRQHPEIECLVSDFLGEVVTKRPDNIRYFAADYFTNPGLPVKLEQLLEARKQRMLLNQLCGNM